MQDYDISKIFSDMESDLIRSMQKNLKRHTDEEIKEGFKWTQWQALKLKELKRFQKENKDILQNYTSSIDKNVAEQIKQQFLEGNANVKKEVKNAMKKGAKVKNKQSKDSFFISNNSKVNTLISATNNDFKEAYMSVLRLMDDTYRKTIFKAQMNLNFGAKTLKQSIDMATKDFLSNGITSITYKDGRNINIANYAEMALRTANKRAYLQGEGTSREQYGINLVYISKYNACSKTCLPWQGRVYIDDVYSKGKDEYNGKYELLSIAIKSGLFHPNCRHKASSYFPKINDIPEIINQSEISQNYEYQQKLNYIDRNITKYKRLKEGSIDEDNINKYNNKMSEWKNIRKQHIELGPKSKIELGEINKNLYYNVTKDKINNNKLIITKDRIEHSELRHPGIFEKYKDNISDIVNNPDYIIKDDKHQYTHLAIKKLEDNVEIVLRLNTDNENNSNSILSMWTISDKRLNNYLKNKNTLYKKE